MKALSHWTALTCTHIDPPPARSVRSVPCGHPLTDPRGGSDLWSRLRTRLDLVGLEAGTWRLLARSRTKYAVPALLAGTLSVAAGPGLAEGDSGAKLLELKARIDQLTRRVEVLEAGADAGPDVRMDKDPAWHLDSYLAESPFKVSQQAFDRKTGRVDLLLNLVAEPGDADLWRAAQIGDPLPIEVTATLTGGGTVGPIPFALHRRTSFGIGTHVHILAQLPVDDPQAIRRLSVRHTGLR